MNVLKSLSGWDGKVVGPEPSPLDNADKYILAGQKPVTSTDGGADKKVSILMRAVRDLGYLQEHLNEYSIGVISPAEVSEFISRFILSLLAMGDMDLFAKVMHRILSGPSSVKDLISVLEHDIEEMSATPGVPPELAASVVRMQIKGFLNNARKE